MIKHYCIKQFLITTLAIFTLVGVNQAKDNWFVAGGVGFNFNSKEDSGASFTFKNNLNFALSAGYKANTFGVALDYNQTDYATNNELKQNNNIIIKVKQASVYVAPFININVNKSSNVYLKSGVGYNWPSAKIKDVDGKTNFKKALAWKVGLGYQYSINSNNAIMAEYNFINNGLKDFFGISHSRHTYHSVNVLYKYTFAG